ncbi:hypothetical protein KKG41_05815 [Patescibacteria group bacterium]|nr:hypothetical protein [Patescibacteria group bacterium]MBU1889981.1 hypothetical protein [Patescibacteria group bacterium]
MPDIEWIYKLKKQVPGFLNQMKGKHNPGFYKYSLSGDLYNENQTWGLGNTVFAIKIYYTLNLLKDLSLEEKKAASDFILSFQNPDGLFYDPLIKRLTKIPDIIAAIKGNNFNNFFHQQTKRAETRQSISALQLMNEGVQYSDKNLPSTEIQVTRYLNNLDWSKPWGAGSHFSHLIFFLKNSQLPNRSDLINYAISWVNQIQSHETGSWYKGNPTLRQKINGAMKVITALKVADKMSFSFPDKIIDMCLSAKNDETACDNFNIIYVLHYANQVVGENYRRNEINQVVLERLELYRRQYYPEIGGFSFLPGQANTYYYGAKITRGSAEPDIHGTVMFLWGISIIAQILNIYEKLGFNEFTP